MAGRFEDLPAGAQTAILAGLGTVIGIAAFWYLALPRNAERAALHKQVASLRAQNDRNSAAKRQNSEYVKRIAQAKQRLDALRSIVPDEPAVGDFIRSVYELGSTTGVHVRTFVAEPQVDRKLYVEMPFTAHLDGTYYGVLRFFERLGTEPRIVTVNGFELGQPEGGGMGAYQVSDRETVSANCTIATYYAGKAGDGKTRK